MRSGVMALLRGAHPVKQGSRVQFSERTRWGNFMARLPLFHLFQLPLFGVNNRLSCVAWLGAASCYGAIYPDGHESRRRLMTLDSSASPKGKLVIKNVGLLLSGDITRPILDADTVMAVDGLITQVGKANDCDVAQADTLIDANGTCLCPGLID